MTEQRNRRVQRETASSGQHRLPMISHLLLDQTFDCGQCFRWEREADGSYTGIAYSKILNVSVAELDGTCQLVLDNADEREFDALWRPYFDYDRDYEELARRLCDGDQVMQAAAAFGSGIRILRQDPWETLISFLISQNNNIPRIRGCIEELCSRFGERLGTYRGKQRYGFPTPDVLAGLTETDLAPCRLGYRARYLIETAREVAKDGGEILRSMRNRPALEAEEYLLSLSGVGPKVASCVMLFSMDKLACFPVDVWMRRVMAKCYGFEEKDVKGMQDYAARTFGEYGGIAQQYLFYYIRGMEEKEKQ